MKYFKHNSQHFFIILTLWAAFLVLIMCVWLCNAVSMQPVPITQLFLAVTEH